jgi:hypothetical protein
MQEVGSCWPVHATWVGGTPLEIPSIKQALKVTLNIQTCLTRAEQMIKKCLKSLAGNYWCCLPDGLLKFVLRVCICVCACVCVVFGRPLLVIVKWYNTRGMRTPQRMIQDKTSNILTTRQWGAFVQPLLPWKSSKYYIFWVCVCSCSYPACKRHMWSVWLYHISSRYLINGTILGRKLLNIKCVFLFSTNFVWNISDCKKNSVRCFLVKYPL